MKLVLSVMSTLLLTVPGVVCQNTQSPSPSESTARPFTMLVLGDSVLWGEGIKTEHKSWHHVKLWIQKNTGRPVIDGIEAHAGAVIDGGSAEERVAAPDGEVDSTLPSVLNQVERFTVGMTISGANGSEAVTTHGAMVPWSGPKGAPRAV
jgi:hypothetical protein